MTFSDNSVICYIVSIDIENQYFSNFQYNKPICTQFLEKNMFLHRNCKNSQNIIFRYDMIPVSGKGGTDRLKRCNWPFEKRMEVLIFFKNW